MLEGRWLLSGIPVSPIVVSNASDLVDGDTSSIAALLANDGGDGISLREAVNAANSTAGADAITFDPSLSGQTITLGGTQLEISGDLTIDGPGAGKLTIDANQKSRVFHLVDSGVTAEVSGCTMTNAASGIGGAIYNNGLFTVSQCTLAGNSAPRGDGGGIFNSGTLVVADSLLSGNSAAFGGGICNNSGTVTLTGSTISDSTGSGIYNGPGMVTVTDSTLSGNSAIATDVGVTSGGAISNDANGTLIIANSALSGNTAGDNGGAIYSNVGALTITNCTLSDNTAQGAFRSGGAILSDGPLTIANCTLSGNSAAYGAGIASEGGSAKVTNSTITGNVAVYGGGGIAQVPGGPTTINDTIVAGNTLQASGAANDILDVGYQVVQVTGSNNLLGDPATAGGLANGVNGNIVGNGSGGLLDLTTVFVDANSDGKIDAGDLADNGGPTQTLALKAGSPAIDAGANALAVDASGASLTTDQRGAGFARVANGAVDIGAYEVQAASPLVVTNTNDDGLGSLRAAIQYANSNPGPDTITFNIPATDPNFIDDDASLTGGDAAADVFVIQPLSALPTLTDGGTTIDGRTQTAFGGDANPFGPEIVLDGSQAGSASGLTLTSDGNAVLGLDIRAFSGDGIAVADGNQNWIAGNDIGTDATGTIAAGNATFGILLNGRAKSNILGANGDGAGDASEGNLISGNGAGIVMQGADADDNVVAGNLIGTDRTGNARLGQQGDNVSIVQGAHDNLIGTNGDGVSDALERNVIVGAQFAGVALYNDNTDGNVVAGNYIGVNAAGDTAIGNQFGVIFGYSYGGIGQHNTRIGTNSDGVSDDLERNVISGNARGIVMDIASHTLVAGNYIGADATGETALANGDAISMAGHDNTIGGSTAAARNVISGNGAGISIAGAGAYNNTVAGNYIGTNKEGETALANGGSGVNISGGSQNNVIGTNGDGVDDADERNVISGNAGVGVLITDAGTDDNVVAGNYIGADATGAVALANGASGVQIDGGSRDNRIGANGDGVGDADERNVISGNSSNGITITDAGTSGNVVAGNYIGADASGDAPVANLGAGVLTSAPSNIIGGHSAALRNLISGNAGAGINISSGEATGNVVEGNYIGVDVTGAEALANGIRGVSIYGGANHNLVGTNGDGVDDAAERNVIAGNQKVGIVIQDAGTEQNVVAGNYLGTNAAGDAPIASAGDVVLQFGASFNRIGADGRDADADAEANVISGSTAFAQMWIQSDGTTGNVIAGDRIGTNAAGTAALATFDAGDLEIAVDGNDEILDAAPLSFTPLNDTTVRVGGLDSLTGANGIYVFAVNAAGIQDIAGNAGLGTAAAGWLMDTAAPLSRVDALPRRAAGKQFTVSVSGSDPMLAGAPSSGAASYDVYVTVDGAPYTLWKTLPAGSPSATFTAESNHTYGFRSVAIDKAGNLESKPVAVEASTYVPDLDAPVTHVTNIDSTSPTFTVSFSGSDTGGSGLATIGVFAQVDGGPAQNIGTFNAGGADGGGTIAYQAIADGASHTYRFYTVGVDGNGNVEAAPLDGGDKTATGMFASPAALAVTNFDVQDGAAQRSYIRYVDITFNEGGTALEALVDSLTDGDHANDRIRLTQEDVTGSAASQTGVPLTASMITISGQKLRIDFGPGGIGGDPNSNVGDGYYALAFDLDGSLANGLEAVDHFYRLYGDANGDRTVDSTDLYAINAAIGQCGANLDQDVNGDAVVTVDDLFAAYLEIGEALDGSLTLDD